MRRSHFHIGYGGYDRIIYHPDTTAVAFNRVVHIGATPDIELSEKVATAREVARG